MSESRGCSFIKRVVGIPGDRLHTHERALYRNGSQLAEDYAVYMNPKPDPRREFPPISDSLFSSPSDQLLKEMLDKNQQNGEIVVPDGKYFVLGDNRDNSLDSRYFGFVDRKDIVASPLVIYASYEVDPTTGSIATRSILNMRWKRILKLF